ncbi:pyridoxal phosphate-dependent transferase [Biscogniauxia sp. FL1348]|nr:pyridoxal phosphate-dependent transferase [Biscogniauxia sp. FL1348]
MDSKQFREAAISSIEEIVKYYDNIEDRRVLPTVEPGYLRKLLPADAPEEGEPWADIQKDIEAKIMPGITHWQSPNFLAWFPSSSSFPAMLGEMYSAAFTGAAFNWICSPAVTELETIVLDWLARGLGLPPCFHSAGPTAGGGVIHGTASEAVATVMVAAREAYLRAATSGLGLEGEALEDALAERRGRLVALAGAAAHTATKKAAQIAGVRFRAAITDSPNMFAVPARAEDGHRLTGAALRDAIAGLRARGLEPFYVTATFGTTDTCAVDDMDGIAAAVADADADNAAAGTGGKIWVHVDAAYAGVALLCAEYRPLMGDGGALGQFHSFNTNLHKWLLVNFDCSAVWVRDRGLLTGALRVAPLAILANAPTDSGLVTDYRDWQIPFGRRFRSLKVWFVLRSYGLAGLRAHVRRHVALAETFAAALRARPDLFDIVTGPRFALTVFRLRGKGKGKGEEEEEKTLEAQNALTKKLYDDVVAGGKIFLSSTVVGGVFAIRHNPATPLVEERHVRKHVEILVEAAEKVLAPSTAEGA